MDDRFEARLQALETRNDRLSRQVKWLRIALGAVGVTGGLLFLSAGGPAVGKLLEAQEFRVTNKDGSPRITLTANPASPGIALFGDDGTVRASLTLSDGAPRFRLMDAVGNPAAVVSVSDPQGARVVLTGPGKMAALVSVGADGPVMGLTDSGGAGVFRTP